MVKVDAPFFICEAQVGVDEKGRADGLMRTYEKICEHMRANIAQASSSFPNSEDALLAWLLDDLEDEIIPERDRMGLKLAARAVIEEIKKTRQVL